jgi:hypothetical protein
LKKESLQPDLASLLERFELCVLAVDDPEQNITRLHLTVRQELRVAEDGALDCFAGRCPRSANSRISAPRRLGGEL